MPTDPIKRYPEERRLAMVLFADVQGFTALAERPAWRIWTDRPVPSGSAKIRSSYR